MRIQACRFIREKDGKQLPEEYGFAIVREFGLYDIHGILDEQGNKVRQEELYTYSLLCGYPGCYAEVGHSLSQILDK